jgi:hypothetical protein
MRSIFEGKLEFIPSSWFMETVIQGGTDTDTFSVMGFLFHNGIKCGD